MVEDTQKQPGMPGLHKAQITGCEPNQNANQRSTDQSPNLGSLGPLTPESHIRILFTASCQEN